MTPLDLYAAAGAVLVLTGFWGMAARAHLFWKLLGFNLMGSGIFLLLLAVPPRVAPDQADPVTQAMVLTGIVVAAAATAVALGMALRVQARSGLPFLEEDREPGDRHGTAGEPPEVERRGPGTEGREPGMEGREPGTEGAGPATAGGGAGSEGAG